MLEHKGLVWLLRLGNLLLIFLCGYFFLQLSPIWKPILVVIGQALVPFIIAVFITYLLHPVVEKLHGTGVPRPFAILLIYFIFFGGIGFGAYKGLPALLNQLRHLAENIPHLIDIYRGWVNELYVKTSHFPEGFQERINQTLSGLEAFLNEQISRIFEILKGALSFFLLFAIIPFVVFYLLKDMMTVKKAVWYLTPRRWRERGRLLVRDIDNSLGSYIRGQLLVAFVVSILTMLGFWIIGMDYPFLLGIIMGIADIIPYFGPFIGAFPAVVLAATISGEMVVYVLFTITIIQVVEGNILSPLIVGKSLHIHPILIIFALLLGEQVGGMVGLILAVPVMAVVKVLLLHFREHMIKH